VEHNGDCTTPTVAFRRLNLSEIATKKERSKTITAELMPGFLHIRIANHPRTQRLGPVNSEVVSCRTGAASNIKITLQDRIIAWAKRIRAQAAGLSARSRSR